MKLLFMEWKSLGQQDIAREFEQRGWIIDYYPFPRETENTRLNNSLCERIAKRIIEGKYDIVFSFNYFPVISIACNACRVKYVSWTFDSPFIQLYSNTIHYPYNYVFVFDKGTCMDLWQQGVQNVYYLPMAASVQRYESYCLTEEVRKFYETDIAFIGSTYQEKKNQFYDRLSGISEYCRGYLEGCMNAQKGIYGDFFLEKMISPDIMKELMASCPLVVNEDGFERLEWVYAHYFLARNITALEREQVLQMLSEKYKVDLYTYEETPRLSKVNNRGTAEVLQEASFIYRSAKINLNISLKSIISGIPLRAFEIMGSGGFLCSNYQQDFAEFFNDGEDYIYYSDYDELMNKVEYYLGHEKERKEIADNGKQKIKTMHTYKNRLDAILEIIN